jgi:hypothetical protein
MRYKFRQALMVKGKFTGWHYWGFIGDKFVAPAFSEGVSGVAAAAKHSQQYTGEKDKKKAHIYGGDILQVSHIRYEVFWSKGDCGWMLKHPGQTDDDGFDFEFLSNYNTGILEVIGNIQESPELLKPRCEDCDEHRQKIAEHKASMMPAKCFPVGGKPCLYLSPSRESRL